MFKTLYFLSFLTISLNATTIYNGKCVDYYYINSSKKLVIEYSNGSISKITESKSKLQELTENQGYWLYEENNNTCVSSIESMYGMNEMQFNFFYLH